MYLNLFDCSAVVNTIENYTIFVEWISLNRSSIKAKINCKSTFGEKFIQTCFASRLACLHELDDY